MSKQRLVDSGMKPDMGHKPEEHARNVHRRLLGLAIESYFRNGTRLIISVCL